MHRTTRGFWKCYDVLPAEVRASADRQYDLLKQDPGHPSLHFKKTGKYWSVRVGLEHRALGLEHEDGILWFWIGTHAEYDRLISHQ